MSASNVKTPFSFLSSSVSSSSSSSFLFHFRRRVLSLSLSLSVANFVAVEEEFLEEFRLTCPSMDVAVFHLKSYFV